MKIAISTESACDLPKALIEEYDIHVLPYHLVIGDEEYLDGELSADEVIARAEQKRVLPKTAAINESEFTEHFGKLLADYDAVVHISLSSEITSATGNARAAAAKAGNVYVVDSRTLSSGIGLLAVYAAELARAGLTAVEIAARVAEKTAYVQCSSVIEKTDYLYKGGRCNSLAHFGANLLKIRPRITVRRGKIGTDRKYHGNILRVLERYCREILADFPPDKGMAIVVYTTATPEMIAVGRKACENAGFERVYEAQAGGTVTSHCGSHVLGIMYFAAAPDLGKKR